MTVRAKTFGRLTAPPAPTIGIVGAACRLPGAPDEAAFRALLAEGRSAVRPAPEGRWNVARHLHPARNAPGYAYSFAGGYLQAPFAFDTTVFGLSPREAAQMDPQQRLLLEVVRDALDDAEIPSASLARGEVGVYVGGSSLDHGNIHSADPASIDSHFMTGNTLSILANRISYVFDLRGPSFTVDTACSSSLVAFARAVADLEAGRIETAIVAGVNVLLSPLSFVGFSRASMLSQTGLCRPFSADGDGYVRSEGAVALVLTRADRARPGALRATIEAADVNSDGRTSGIALPGLDGQTALLERIYRDLDADALAFVEAHGTGTRVGDPIEAEALGRIIGRRRSRPLPIGSVKSNIGHLEPASGVAGLMKALIALETRVLPASLHLDALHPDIDFDGLNLAPARECVVLPEGPETLLAGVSSFGFGGTNAHVVLRSAPKAPVAPATEAPSPPRLVVSAASREALRAGAKAVAERLKAGIGARRLATALAAGRDLMNHRAVVALDVDDLAGALAGFAADGRHGDVEEGLARGRDADVCLVYSGNGAQWAGMGRIAFARNAAFRARFEEVSTTFARLSDRSLVDDLHDPELAEKMRFGAFLQPILFGLQTATTASLVAAGLRPTMVVGHSIGELAAATDAGAIGLEDALRIIVARSACQEAVHGRGTMAVFAAGRDTVADLLAALGRDDVEIAADNGPSSVTISGSDEGVALAVHEGRRRRIASRTLDIEYPFHSRFVEGLRERMLETLGPIAPRPAAIPVISTVTGEPIGDRLLDADHWWWNVRAPVRFRDAIGRAAAHGAGLFVEIGPRPILQSPIADTLRDVGSAARTVATLAEADDRRAHADPIARIVARLVANGATLVEPAAPPPVDRTLGLPAYAWQRREHRFAHTSEWLDVFGEELIHPLIGARLAQGQHEWRTRLDARLQPWLADHVVEGEIVVPAAAIAEMILAVGRDLKPEGPLAFEDLDVLVPLTLPADGMRELSIRHAGATDAVEIWSRPRFGPDEWSLNARARLAAPTSPRRPPAGSGTRRGTFATDAIYAAASIFGIDYGPAFRLALACDRRGDTMTVETLPATPVPLGQGLSPLLLHPASLDAALHPLFCFVDADPASRETHLPVGIARLVLHRDGATVVAASVRVERETANTLTVGVHLFDAEGRIVAEADGIHMRRIMLEQRAVDDVCFRVETCRRERAAPLDPAAVIGATFAGRGEETPDEARLMLRAHMLATAHRALRRVADAERRLDIAAAVLAGRLSPEATGWVGRMAEVLADAGLADLDAAGIRLAAETGLPAPEPILATFAAEFPSASDELLHAARTAAEVDGFLAEGAPPARRRTLAQTFEAMPLLSAAARRSVDAALRAVMSAAGDVPPRLLVAQSHARRLLALMLGHVQRTGLRVTVAGTDRARLDRLAARLPTGSGIDVRDLAMPSADGPRFDLAVMVASHCRDDDLLEKMAGEVIDGGALLLLHPMDDGLIDFWFGMAEDWFAGSLDPLLPIGGVCPIGDARRRLERLGCSAIGEHAVGAPDEIALIGRLPAREPKAAPTAVARILDEATVDAGLLAAFRNAFAARGGRLVEADTTAERIRLFPRAIGDDRSRTVAALETLRADLLAETGATRLAVVLRTGSGTDRDPVCDAIRGFLRVALNERVGTRIRVLDLDPALDDAAAGAALADWIARDDGEADTTVTPDGAFVPRIRRGLPAAPSAEAATEALEAVLPRRGALEHFTWRPKPRRAPGLGEIEVEVIATGLNFRDVMLAMGLLDEGDVADGLAGADYGFECVGRVVALGEGAARFRPGDVVLGFAPRAFASHVTGPADVFVPAPEGIEPTAAATVPVAFVTAWYGLVECARLKPGEVVLVHGAAGGVGLAALQVARSLGARVVATVSTPEKRALARLFGAETILDSRSLDFVDTVRKDLGGVDVVLNSLSGDAMRAGVKCLKPFGRFVELGKRDYVANTELALRPFRRNLTYHGVDVDQLLAHDPSIVARGFAAIAEGFREGRFSALPHRLFEADEIGEAFRLMQAAGHVGKILVRPPVPGTRRLPPAPTAPFAPGDGVQLVVGGTGGFGLATALHLADEGARRIVVASRSGRLEDGAAEKVAALAACGVDFRVETVDAADLDAVEALIARTARDVGPISGVWLTAMVLDDGLLADLDAARIDRVLAPKVAGAVNLDRATRGQPVETFVLFSSAAALVGSPGQSAYAAANAFVEGLARRRRAEGLPALAVAWGAIADVGVLAREGATAARLERVTGVAGFRAREALARLDDLLARADRFDDPVICCAGFRKVGALRDLALLATPAFEDFLRGDGESEEGETDLATLIDGKSDGEALKILCDIVAGEVARILRLAPSEVDVGRPLDELGLDSLMALELRMNVESRFGVELPLVAITSVKNLHDLARRLLQSLRGGDTAEEGRLDAGDESLIAMHGGDGEAFAGLSAEIEAHRKRVEGRT